jgi:hypothetical protein
MRTSLKAALVVALLPIAVLSRPSPANAVDPDFVGGAVTGAGLISPGLTLLPAPQDFSFSGTATLGLHGSAISANGTDLAGSILEGVGFINLTAPFACSGVFVRVAAVVVVIPTPLCGGGGVFAFVPNQVGLPPEAGGTTVVTSYTLIGVGAAYLVPV